ncbi:molybdopterin molybdotransferase MoeA [Porphyrobacter sp. ULC335]|uniref:molybdopterin molybdotransferase MoeA n=1 Tax=Porphyrobacter sp. ULC335 TaxID=2854260 RepID=UPI002220B798|nr:molybdopterin molybdotransferase MoeA [Porphyrobacter sp. ULC335]UYV14861.1 molybdopterin molybdotransferase MoeA [Porphyrobacter sp. ULC335]
MNAPLGLEEAQARLLALAPQPPSCVLGLSTFAERRFLAKDVTALRTQPAADLSAMDGYAITSGAGPWQRVGESRAGAPYPAELAAGQCVRISTGAIVPEGAVSVLLQEDARVEDNLVTATELPPPGKHIRKAGFDFRDGDTVLTKGTAYSPAVLALAASAGHGVLSWRLPPGVAVLDSGDELVAPGKPCGPHQTPASNGVMLAAMLSPYVGFVDPLGPVADDRAALAAALKRAEDSHILITSGGASVGDHDLIQQALKDWGAKIDFWRVAIKPGKPLMVATREDALGRQVILGLPGNPVSSFVTAFLFALPLVRASMGDPDPLPRAVTMLAGEDLPAIGPRREFLRAMSDGESVRLAGSQDSSALSALAAADCLIDRPAHAPPVAAGEPVRVFRLQNG